MCCWTDGHVDTHLGTYDGYFGGRPVSFLAQGLKKECGKLHQAEGSHGACYEQPVLGIQRGCSFDVSDWSILRKDPWLPPSYSPSSSPLLPLPPPLMSGWKECRCEGGPRTWSAIAASGAFASFNVFRTFVSHCGIKRSWGRRLRLTNKTSIAHSRDLGQALSPAVVSSRARDARGNTFWTVLTEETSRALQRTCAFRTVISCRKERRRGNDMCRTHQ